MTPTTRMAGSFAIVMIAYWAYALVAVPWIEPPVDLGRAAQITENERKAAEEQIRNRMRSLDGLFLPGSWELKDPKILDLDNGRAKLLFQGYDTLPDGRVSIKPVTMVFAYQGAADDEVQRRRQSIILEAGEEGAVLKFDQPLDFNKMKAVHLVSGELKGKVHIRSDWKQPGPEDDLRIDTSDIHLTEQTISTPNLVDFRWGPHFGHGRDMVIKLLAGPSKGAGPSIAIESFELRHVERLHLDLGQRATSSSPGANSASVPVEINCRGPFRFDKVKRVATFSDHVDVLKKNSVGPPDQINGDLLSLHFTDRPKDKSAALGNANAKAADSLDLAPERIEVQGKPAIVTAPSQNVILRAPSLDYKLGAGGRLGEALAQGPGNLLAWQAKQPDQQFEAIWKDWLRLEPAEANQHRISLTGGAELRAQKVGQLQAREIFFWLTELPSAIKDQSFELHPHSALARNDVHMNYMNSPQISCEVDKLQVWFKERGRGQGTEVGDQGPASAGRGIGGSPRNALAPQQDQSTALKHLKVFGRELIARLLLGGPEPELTNLTIEKEVRLIETQTSSPEQRPLMILGDRLVGENLSAPNATVIVTGRPARLEGRGLGLSGSNINLDGGTNHLKINGPGQMDLLLNNNLQGLKLTAPSTLTVDWQREMEFDGRTARFEDGVVATAPHLQFEAEYMQFQLQTQTMRVMMDRPVNFQQPNAHEPPTVEELQCSSGVSMENRTFDLQKELQSHYRMDVSDLIVNRLTGAVNGGPGSFNTVFYARSDTLPQTLAAPGVPAATPAQNRLVCLHVKFLKSITGNLLRRKLTVDDWVQAAYAPVDNWDAVLTTFNPVKLGPDGVVMSCDQLSVTQMLVPLGNRQSIEVEARGNSVVEGIRRIGPSRDARPIEFKARGHQITYDQAKDWLILRGDGRNNAELFQQDEPGALAPRFSAQEFHYSLKTQEASIVAPQVLQFTPPPAPVRAR